MKSAGMISTVLFFLMGNFFTQAQADEIRYAVTDLGTLGGDYSKAYGINNFSQIIGQAYDSNGQYHAFLWENGQKRTIDSSNDKIIAYGINNLGQIVGMGENSNGRYVFLYSNGTMRNLGTLGGIEGFGLSINDAGQITGFSTTAYGLGFAIHAVLWSENSGMQDIGVLNGVTSYGKAINNRGQIVGSSGGHAFMYDVGNWTDLGTLGGIESDAHAVNNAGQIVGISDTADSGENYHAFLYQNGKMTDLGTLGGDCSNALSINSLGQIVGFSDLIAGNGIGPEDERAVLWENDRLLDLNELIPENSGWVLMHASGINDHGQIIGDGFFSGSKQRAYLLTPVPEPITLFIIMPILFKPLKKRSYWVGNF